MTHTAGNMDCSMKPEYCKYESLPAKQPVRRQSAKALSGYLESPEDLETNMLRRYTITIIDIPTTPIVSQPVKSLNNSPNTSIFMTSLVIADIINREYCNINFA
jgi:hypothetical protein